ncbi:hypothetical protein IQ06DRAFT_11798 [Phaeosphaeriaceae sp. SRC1lsM3a]|nr:hypothetical protein IQ06DRAFT_11798 [Stagonospora sp. SRC1lsM3a]
MSIASQPLPALLQRERKSKRGLNQSCTPRLLAACWPAHLPQTAVPDIGCVQRSASCRLRESPPLSSSPSCLCIPHGCTCAHLAFFACQP